MGILLELILEAVWLLLGDLVFGVLGALLEPLLAGGLLWSLERLRRPERRAPVAATMGGALFGLAWLAVRLVIPRG